MSLAVAHVEGLCSSSQIAKVGFHASFYQSADHLREYELTGLRLRQDFVHYTRAQNSSLVRWNRIHAAGLHDQRLGKCEYTRPTVIIVFHRKLRLRQSTGMLQCFL